MSIEEAEYHEVKAASDRIQSRLAAAIAKDRAEADAFWANLRALADHLWNYGAERARFDQDVAARIERAQDAANLIETRIRELFFPFRQHPALLEQDAADWEHRSREAQRLMTDLTKMHPVDGWTGPAADTYGEAVKVQRSAVGELAGVMNGAATGAEQGALLHRALFALAREACVKALTEADVDLPGHGNMYYLRTTWWGDVLALVPDVLQQIAELVNVKEAVDHLSSQLDQSVTMANLLDPGAWPTGVDAADIPPADTGSAVTGDSEDHADFAPPPSTTPGVCHPGVQR